MMVNNLKPNYFVFVCILYLFTLLNTTATYCGESEFISLRLLDKVTGGDNFHITDIYDDFVIEALVANCTVTITSLHRDPQISAKNAFHKDVPEYKATGKPITLNRKTYSKFLSLDHIGDITGASPINAAISIQSEIHPEQVIFLHLSQSKKRSTLAGAWSISPSLELELKNTIMSQDETSE